MAFFLGVSALGGDRPWVGSRPRFLMQIKGLVQNPQRNWLCLAEYRILDRFGNVFNQMGFVSHFRFSISSRAHLPCELALLVKNAALVPRPSPRDSIHLRNFVSRGQL
jgi:hypothetical protein